MTASRPTVPDVTRAALTFVEAHGLDLPLMEVSTNHPTSQAVDPAAVGTNAAWTTLPPGHVRVHFVRTLRGFLAWCSALGAARVGVDRDRPEHTHVTVSAWRDGIQWHVTGLLPHEYGTPHLPGADVRWHDRRHGTVSVDGLASHTAAVTS